MNRELHLQNVPTKRASSRKLYELLFTVMPEAQKPTQVVIIKNFLSRYQKQYNIGVHSRLLSDRSNTSKTSIAAQSGKVNSDWKMNVTVFMLKKKKKSISRSIQRKALLPEPSNPHSSGCKARPTPGTTSVSSSGSCGTPLRQK